MRVDWKRNKKADSGGTEPAFDLVEDFPPASRSITLEDVTDASVYHAHTLLAVVAGPTLAA
jgi:hypothetical protein